MQEATVPAAPPDNRLNSFIREAVIVMAFMGFAATRVDPPRQADLPPRKILVTLFDVPPRGMCGESVADVAPPPQPPHFFVR